MKKRFPLSTPTGLTLAAIGSLLLILLALPIVGLGDARRVVQGETMVYLMSRGAALYAVGFACVPFFLGCAVAVRGGIFRLFSVPLFVVAVVFLSIVGPTISRDRVEVSAEHFRSSHGFWYAPVEHRIEFASTACLEIHERTVGGVAGPTYDLLCTGKNGSVPVVIPIGDLMKVALPEIVVSAEAAGVPVLDPAGLGLPVPGGTGAEQDLNMNGHLDPELYYTLVPGFGLIVCVLVVCGWRRKSENRAKSVNAIHVCYGLYLIAIVTLVVTFGPDNNDLDTDFGPAFGLVTAGIVLVTGAVGHIILWLRGQTPGLSEQKRWIWMVIASGPVFLGISWFGANVERCHAGLTVIGVVAGMLIIAYLWAVRHLNNLPMNRMAVLIQEQKYADAIAIGEAQPVDTRHPAVTLNLAVACHHVGRRPEARELLASLKTRSDLPDVFSQLIERLENEFPDNHDAE